MTSQQPPLSEQHRADVQGLRALAVLLVVVYHAGLPLTGGYVGVDVFFVISGYVIVGSLMRSWQSAQLNLLEFYFRRVRRLLPAFALVVSFTLLMSLLFSTYDARTQAFETARAGALFAANLQLMLFRPNSYFTSSEQANPLLHTWSLSLEEQIYFVFPLVMYVLWIFARGRLRTKRLVLGAAMTVMTLFSLLASYSFTYARPAWPFDDGGHLARGLEASMMIAFYSPFTRVWEFLAGGLVAVVGYRARGVVGRLFLIAGASAVVFASFTFDSATMFPGVLAAIPVLGTVLMLLGTDIKFGRISILESRAAGWIGDRSYSIYLWHWPLIQFAKGTFPDERWSSLFGLAISIPLAMLAFRFVEQPLRHSKTITARRWTSGLLLVACSGSVFALASIRAIEPTPELQVHVDVTSDCVRAQFDVILADTTCLWPFPGATRDALLVGDSQAGHLTESFIAAAHLNGLNARVVTRTGAFMNNPERDYLSDLVAQSETIDLVVVGQLTFEIAQIDQWNPLIEDFLNKLTASDRKVIFVHRVRKGGNPLDCAPVRLLLDHGACEVGTQESLESEQYVLAMKRKEAAMISRMDDVLAFDPNEWLCELSPCFSRRDDGWLWRDPSHLSRLAASRLSEPLGDVIARALSD